MIIDKITFLFSFENNLPALTVCSAPCVIPLFPCFISLRSTTQGSTFFAVVVITLMGKLMLREVWGL